MTKVWPRVPLASETESFVTIVNSEKPLTFVAKIVIFDFCGVLTTPLYECAFQSEVIKDYLCLLDKMCFFDGRKILKKVFRVKKEPN